MGNPSIMSGMWAGLGQQVSSTQRLASQIAGSGVRRNSKRRKRTSSATLRVSISRRKKSGGRSRKSAGSNGKSKRGRLVKGSAAAKRYMAKIRAKRR